MMSKHSIVRILTTISIGLILGVGALGQNSDAQKEHGLNVGQQAPEFTLKNQNGKPVSLSDLLKKGPVALVFYRSADW